MDKPYSKSIAASEPLENLPVPFTTNRSYTDSNRMCDGLKLSKDELVEVLTGKYPESRRPLTLTNSLSKFN